MEIVLRVFQVFLALGLIGVVLLQRSEGGGLGIGSSGGAGSFMSVRGTANFLTRVTAILAALFMITCLALALIAKPTTAPKSIFDTPANARVPVPSAPALPPSAPSPSETLPSSAPAPSEKPLSTELPAPTVVAPVPSATPSPVIAPSVPAPAAQDKKAPQPGPAHTPGQ